MRKFYSFLLATVALLCSTAANAQSFTIDNLDYAILSSTDKTVEVTSGSNKYSGAVTIPASITYNSTTYSVTSIGESAFFDCDGLTSVEIPSSVTSIGNSAFYDCDGLTSIEIPSSVTSIGNYAFSYCDGLTSIVVDEGNTIYDSRGNCNAIIETASNTLIAGFKNTIIPSSVTSIGNSAFYGCSGLTSIEIPSSVTSISDYAFSHCSGLTSIEIPSSVTSIGFCAFGNCTGLTSIEIPSSVTSIGKWAFINCTGLTSIVSHIAAEDLFAPVDDAFYNVDKTNCTLYVPVGAKSTYAATEQWKEFKNIVEPNGKCGDNAYWALNVETGALTIFGTGAIYNYAYNDANRAPWYSNKEDISSVSIEEGVTSIGDFAFEGCTILTSIEIPSSVTSIGWDAFAHCYGLTSIEIPSSVTSIDQNAFWGCIGLTSIEIPSSVTSIGQSAFSNCYGLTSIVVDEGNTIYDSRGNCNAIIETASNTLIAGCKNTIIPEGVTNIGNYAFSGCYGLTSIEIPSSVTSISEGAFHDCNVLTSIEIPNSVTSIGNSAFYNCSGLTSIEIPSSVTSIGNNAFRWCTGLTSIVSHIAAENLFAPGENAFSDLDKDACTLYVPAGAKSTYAATEQWKDFTNIVETYDLTVTAAGYATLYLGTAVEIPAGVEAYTAARIEGDLLKMQAVEDVIPANTAVIIKAEEGNYLFAYSDETPDAIEGNLLRGTLTDTYIKPASAQTAYVLSKVDGVVGMYRAKLKADGTFKNNANRVYMLLGDINVGEGDLDTSSPGGQLSNGYRFDFSGTTAIESVENEQQGEAVYYDLSGRRVENPTKGIYIVNGKKVLVK